METLLYNYKFQSTLPTRGSDYCPRATGKHRSDFNPRSPRGGATVASVSSKLISTDFNPRSPRGGATGRGGARMGEKVFQSTLPTRGSDLGGRCYDLPSSLYFNPRSPRGGATGSDAKPNTAHKDFNPRSPRGGATCLHRFRYIRPCYFNPRSPRGGATKKALADGEMRYISIHAPHEGERLCRGLNPAAPCSYFNPRSPRGGATKQTKPPQIA